MPIRPYLQHTIRYWIKDARTPSVCQSFLSKTRCRKCRKSCPSIGPNPMWSQQSSHSGVEGLGGGGLLVLMKGVGAD